MGDVCYDMQPRAARRRRIELRRERALAEAGERNYKRMNVGSGGENYKRVKLWPEQVENQCESVTTSSDHGSSLGDADKPRYGVMSVIGRRRCMEDMVKVRTEFVTQREGMHFFGVFDGHGCSHVSKACQAMMDKVVEEEMDACAGEELEDWEGVMERSFLKMDRIATAEGQGEGDCWCELQSPVCYAVGSTAVVAVVSPDKIVVGNCGDSRAVLSRGGKAIPLSTDHKPDRPDELQRIEEAGGRVVYWDGPRVCGVLAMSRAIGDRYLKPYVSAVPEVTVTTRTEDDECLILASDGLWDVVSNDTACNLARMCLRAQSSRDEGDGDVGCRDAALLLTKLALARQSHDNVTVLVINLNKS